MSNPTSVTFTPPSEASPLTVAIADAGWIGKPPQWFGSVAYRIYDDRARNAVRKFAAAVIGLTYTECNMGDLGNGVAYSLLNLTKGDCKGDYEGFGKLVEDFVERFNADKENTKKYDKVESRAEHTTFFIGYNADGERDEIKQFADENKFQFSDGYPANQSLGVMEMVCVSCRDGHRRSQDEFNEMTWGLISRLAKMNFAEGVH